MVVSDHLLCWEDQREMTTMSNNACNVKLRTACFKRVEDVVAKVDPNV